jgi:hypothetical protein
MERCFLWTQEEIFQLPFISDPYAYIAITINGFESFLRKQCPRQNCFCNTAVAGYFREFCLPMSKPLKITT